MNALLDTHTFLWWVMDNPRLSNTAREFISKSDNRLFFSAASGWELAIKLRLGKLKAPDPLEPFIHQEITLHSLQILPIEMRHALHTAALPAHHGDPFDRLLVAQSQLERFPIITADPQISRYDVKVIW